MPKLIPMEEARRQRMPGAEFVHQGHRMYFSELHRACAALELIDQAWLSIFDAYWIRNFQALQGALLFQATSADRMALYNRIQHQTLDDLKIGAGIELCLKANLVFKGFIVHKLKREDETTKTLSAAQQNRPISVAELICIEGYRYNGKLCLLPALLPKSIEFSTLLKAKYKAETTLSDRDVLLVEIFKDRRNMIHLPNDEPDNPEKLYMSDLAVDDLTTFVETHLVNRSEAILETILDDHLRRLWRDRIAGRRGELQKIRGAYV